MIDIVLQLIEMLLRRWKLVFFYMLAVGILASAMMLIVPKSYNSHATIQPVTATESSGILGVLSGLTGGSSSGQGESGLLRSILDSRSLLESVVDEFNLMEVYEAEVREELIAGLRDDYEVSVSDEGAIHLSFATHTGWLADEQDEIEVRKRAKNILSHVIKYLDGRNVYLKTQSSRFQREFLENRFNSALQTLDSLEVVFVNFEKETSIVALDAQLEGKIRIATELKQKLVEAETELFVASRSLSRDNPVVKDLELVRASILAQVNKMESNAPNADSYALDQTFPTFASIPDLSIRFKHIEMELETHFKILEFLGTQLEEAKLGEAKDTPTIQVIDVPSMPELRSSPQRTVTVLVTGIIAFILIATLLYMVEEVTRMGSKPDHEQTIQNLKATFRSIFSRSQ